MGNLKTESLKACGVALRAHNFTKRRGVFLQPGSSPAVTGWLGLNLAAWGLPAKLQINPVVGVRHVSVENALVELAGWPPPVASVSRPVGYLLPQKTFAQWDFPADGNLTAIAEDLANAVATYGQSFIDKWSDWETFATELDSSGLLVDTEKFIVMPIVLAIGGDRRRAESLIRQELDRIGDASDVYSISYREFAKKFAATDF
ncbi:hypothetical protein [Micromonospora zhanjiangensis]|uniref:Uncharacterized protein n=1 Tax=Micromonospora zhanjiangensis TaxID=1522057 RepID=A0ABV8KXB6_9ACTN